MATIDAPLTTRTVTSKDGTALAVHRIGTGPKLWLMPPAMGAPLVSMKHLVERFARDYTIVSWDMRGFYASAAPRGGNAYAFERHVEDMEAVIEAERLDRFVLGGWSMGVQLSLEHYRRSPASVRALVLIAGPYERALTGVFPVPVPGADAIVGGAVATGRAISPGLNFLSKKLLGAKSAAKVLRKAGLLANNAAFFAEVLEDFHKIDWGRYLEVMKGLHAHSAADVLSTIRVPTLITSGTADIMTPVRVARAMHEAIAGSELVLIERATHYLPAEFPDPLNDAIERFLDRVERDARTAGESASA
jgi:pimeloyl-ACP methyl ester carboxylesterase